MSWQREQIGVGVTRCPEDLEQIEEHTKSLIAEAQRHLDEALEASQDALDQAQATTRYAGTGTTVINIIAETEQAEADMQRLVELGTQLREIWGDDGPLPSVQVARVEPGDTLVIHTEQRLRAEDVLKIKDDASKVLPDNPVVILSGGMTLAGVVASSN